MLIHQSVFVIALQICGDAAVENMIGVLQGAFVEIPFEIIFYF